MTEASHRLQPTPGLSQSLENKVERQASTEISEANKPLETLDEPINEAGKETRFILHNSLAQPKSADVGADSETTSGPILVAATASNQDGDVLPQTTIQQLEGGRKNSIDESPKVEENEKRNTTSAHIFPTQNNNSINTSPDKERDATITNRLKQIFKKSLIAEDLR